MIDRDEKWTTKQVDPDKIVCKTCKFKKPDSIINGRVFPQYIKGVCLKYLEPKTKPAAVLFDNADCIFYEHE